MFLKSKYLHSGSVIQKLGPLWKASCPLLVFSRTLISVLFMREWGLRVKFCFGKSPRCRRLSQSPSVCASGPSHQEVEVEGRWGSEEAPAWGWQELWEGYIIPDNNTEISSGDNGGLYVCVARLHPQRSRNSEMALRSVIISWEGAIYCVGKCYMGR